MEKRIESLVERAQKILDRLAIVFKEQNLKVTIDHLDKQTIFLNIERFGPGFPTAFMVKAIGGTFRRYLPEIQEAGIANYSSNIKEEHPSDKCTSPSTSLFAFTALPELDMTGIKVADADFALDNFASLVVRHKLNRFRIFWPDCNMATSTVKNWAQRFNVYMNIQNSDENKFMICLNIAFDATQNIYYNTSEKTDTLPAKLMLTLPRQPEAIKGFAN